MKISSFRGEYRFLSNFYPAEVTVDGEVYPTVEHAYQTIKHIRLKEMIHNAKTPGEAKRLAKLAVPPDWDEVRVPIMESLLRQKFSREPLKSMLLATDDAQLIEGNNWGDTFWGVCNGKGQNNLGKLLMLVRNDLR